MPLLQPNSSSVRVLESCYTRMEKKAYAFTWTIEDYFKCCVGLQRILKSPIFPIKCDLEPQWRLILYPDGSSAEHKDYLSIFLELVSNVKTIQAHFSISLLYRFGVKKNISSCSHRFVKREAWGYTKFLSSKTLFENCPNLRLDGQPLVLHVDINVIGDPVHTEEYYYERQLPIPECKLSQDYGHLLEDQTLCDIVLSVQGKELKAHKTVLAARCPVFSAMFQHEMEEQKNGRVEIADIDHEVLQEMIYFIYTGEIRNIDGKCKELLAAADKYQLDRLKVICEEILRSQMCVENAAELLDLADMYRADQLKSCAIDFIKLHATDVMNADGWKSLVVDKPQLAIQYLLESSSIQQAKAT